MQVMSIKYGVNQLKLTEKHVKFYFPHFDVNPGYKLYRGVKWFQLNQR